MELKGFYRSSVCVCVCVCQQLNLLPPKEGHVIQTGQQTDKTGQVCVCVHLCVFESIFCVHYSYIVDDSVLIFSLFLHAYPVNNVSS